MLIGETGRVAPVASALNADSVEVYFSRNAAGLMIANTRELLSFVAGPDLVERGSPEDLAFISAKRLSFVRPGGLLRQVLPLSSMLRSAFFAGLHLAIPSFELPSEVLPEVQAMSKSIVYALDRGALERLADVAKRLVDTDLEARFQAW